MARHVTGRMDSDDVSTAFGWLCSEVTRHGYDVSEWRLDHTTGPTSYAIIGFGDQGRYVIDILPDNGDLGKSASEAFDFLEGMYRGLIIARQIREKGTWLNARFDQEVNTNG